MINFVNKTPELSNIGDILCSPKFYFKFWSNKDITIVGGGAFNDFGNKAISKYPSSIKIGWALGKSFRFNRLPQLSSFFQNTKKFSAISTRDRNRTSKNIDFVPCVSVFSPLSTLSPGNKISMIFNADPAVSSNFLPDLVDYYKSKHPNILIFNNSLSYRDFFTHFSQTSVVITNSYHAAYWALLSKREVILFGYSSKFLSLLDLFFIDRGKLIKYKRGDVTSLNSAVNIAVSSTKPISVKENFVDEFQNLNLAFASSLKKFDIHTTLLSKENILSNISEL